MKGRYTRDFYIIPTVLIHRGDGIYLSIEFAWLKWYIGFTREKKGEIMSPYTYSDYIFRTPFTVRVANYINLPETVDCSSAKEKYHMV